MRKRASNRTKERAHRFRIRFRRERRASRLPCLSPGLGDGRRSTPESGDVSLPIFVTSMNGCQALRFSLIVSSTSAKPPGFRMAFDAAEKKGRFGRFRVREVKKAAAEERERDEYPSAEEQCESKSEAKSSQRAF